MDKTKVVSEILVRPVDKGIGHNEPVLSANPFHCYHWQSLRTLLFVRHTHLYWEMLGVLCGTYEYEVDGRQCSAHAGDIVLYPAGLSHIEWNPPDDPPELYIIQFHWTGAGGIVHLPLQVQDKDHRCRTMMELFLRSWNNPSDHTAIHRSGSLAGILAQYIQLAEEPENELVMRVRSYMLRHLDEPLTVARLSATVGMSLAHFSRLYRSLCGKTPMNDLRDIRLAQAKQLIVSSDRPLKVIASAVGFSDIHALSHAMRKYMGQTPSQLRSRRKPD